MPIGRARAGAASAGAPARQSHQYGASSTGTRTAPAQPDV